jgi:hypothetical protein
MPDDLNWWDPLRMALGCFLDMMPAEQRAATEEQLKLAVEACENRGEIQAANFCRALAGEEYPVPKPKPKLIVDNS